MRVPPSATTATGRAGRSRKCYAVYANVIGQMAYRTTMWLYAVWGCVGAAVNCGVVFLEASRQVKKGWPWTDPYGPGAAPYAVSIVIQLGIGAATAAAVMGGGVITANSLVAFGIGTASPVVVKKVSRYAQAVLPGANEVSPLEQTP